LLLKELSSSLVTQLGEDSWKLCLVSSRDCPMSLSFCWFYFISFCYKVPYNEGTCYNRRYSFLEYYYMLKFVSLPSESPNLGLVLRTHDKKRNSQLTANQLPFMWMWISLEEKMNCFFDHSIYMYVYNFIFCIVSPCTFLVLTKNGMIFTLYIMKLRIFFNYISQGL